MSPLLSLTGASAAPSPIRALKRFLVRAIWRLWQECSSEPTAHPVAVGTAAA